MRMWPQHFPTLAAARPYERIPEKLANFVYSDRLGNGPPESCDGYRYRGRGLIRIVGRARYVSAGAALEVDLERQPESLLEPRNAAMSAAWIWSLLPGRASAPIHFRSSFPCASAKHG
jgi:putative chitinase